MHCMIYQLHGLISFKHQHSSPYSSRIMHTVHLQPSNRLSDCVLSCRYAGRQLFKINSEARAQGIVCEQGSGITPECIMHCESGVVTISTSHNTMPCSCAFSTMPAAFCCDNGHRPWGAQRNGNPFPGASFVGSVTRKLQCALSASSCSMPLT